MEWVTHDMVNLCLKLCYFSSSFDGVSVICFGSRKLAVSCVCALFFELLVLVSALHLGVLVSFLQISVCPT